MTACYLFNQLEGARDRAASVYIQSIHCIPLKSRLWLYFNVFHKHDLWQDISDAILLLFFCKNRHFLGYKCSSTQNATWILLHSAAASNVLLRNSWAQKYCKSQCTSNLKSVALTLTGPLRTHRQTDTHRTKTLSSPFTSFTWQR